MNFDRDIGRRNTTAAKWARLELATGVSAPDGLAMWVADSDFAAPDVATRALAAAVEHGAFGYGYDNEAYLAAVAWWMKTRHSWAVDPDWVISAQGLGHAIASCIDVWSAPGEGIAYFTPVYHEFRLKTERAHRRPVELPMALVDNRYQLDFDAAAAALTDDTRILLFCSPQNPSGRVWTAAEQRAVAEFAEANDLILISDEVHCDLVFPGQTHIPMDRVAPEYRHRTITLYAASKTFNLAGLRLGQLIIPDPDLRAHMTDRMVTLNYDPATLAVLATTACLSPEGADWVDAQINYLEGNRALFDAGIDAIPGVRSMPLEATYLAWVDFRGTGMTADEIEARLRDDARIGASPGPIFGQGGNGWTRFNLAMPRSEIAEAVARIQSAFADLQ